MLNTAAAINRLGPPVSTTERGRRAEDLAARHLAAHDLEIVARNWRTRYSEIDLIAAGEGIIHIIEVKYRADPSYGDGFDYITPDKQQRLIRAAAAWCQQRGYQGPYQIDVISVIGDLDYPKIDWLQNAIEA